MRSNIANIEQIEIESTKHYFFKLCTSKCHIFVKKIVVFCLSLKECIRIRDERFWNEINFNKMSSSDQMSTQQKSISTDKQNISII